MEDNKEVIITEEMIALKIEVEETHPNSQTVTKSIIEIEVITLETLKMIEEVHLKKEARVNQEITHPEKESRESLMKLPLLGLILEI